MLDLRDVVGRSAGGDEGSRHLLLERGFWPDGSSPGKSQTFRAVIFRYRGLGSYLGVIAIGPFEGKFLTSKISCRSELNDLGRLFHNTVWRGIWKERQN